MALCMYTFFFYAIQTYLFEFNKRQAAAAKHQ